VNLRGVPPEQRPDPAALEVDDDPRNGMPDPPKFSRESSTSRFTPPFLRHTVAMQRLHFRESSAVSACLLAIAGLTLAACASNGGSGNTSPATSSAPTTSSAPSSSSGEPTSGQGAVAAIKANWATFFNAKTSVSHRLALLQDGQSLAKVIKAQSGSTLAATATSKVTSVTLTGTNQASVVYSILLGGQPALSNQHGVAVYQDGVWKVGLVSFCGLLKLENAGTAAGLPSACKG